MTFKAGEAYKHIHNTDIAMHVVKVQYRGDKYWKLRVKWWNIFSKFFLLPMPETVKVSVKDFKNWEWYDQ